MRWKIEDCLFLKISQVQSTLEILINFSRTSFYNDLLKGNFFFLSSQELLYDFFPFFKFTFYSRYDTAMEKNSSTFNDSLLSKSLTLKT